MLLKHFLKPHPVSESFSMRCSNDMTHTSSNNGMSIKADRSSHGKATSQEGICIAARYYQITWLHCYCQCNQQTPEHEHIALTPWLLSGHNCFHWTTSRLICTKLKKTPQICNTVAKVSKRPIFWTFGQIYEQHRSCAANAALCEGKES